MIARYTRPKMGALFTDRHKFDTWLKVELAVCQTWAEAGKIPKAAYLRIKKAARFKLKRIEEIEAEVHHDVIAFTTAVGDHLGKDTAYFHKGLTSSDVVDTAQSLILKEAGQLLEVELGTLRTAVGEQALTHKHTPVVGRTHGVHAEPTSFGLKLLVFFDELGRHEERLAAAIEGISVGKLSGAVGNFAHITPTLEKRALKKLSLSPAPVSNQVIQRDRHAHFICVLAGLGATMEKLAVHLRTYQRTEIGEVQEPFAAGQKGSSAMPHKKNPILLERVTGLARVLRGYALTSLENVALWDERDISNSGAERIILADACILLDYMLAKLTGVVEQLVVRPARMKQNLHLTKGLVFSQRVLLALTDAGVSREEAYAMVQRNAMRCWEDGTPLHDALLGDQDVRAVLSPEKIAEQFSIEPYLAHVDELFARAGLVAKRGRRAKAPVETTADVAAVQNIAERPWDYYESVSVNADKKDKQPAASAEADETLGEAEHQRKLRRTRAASRLSTTRRRGTRGGRRKKKAEDSVDKKPSESPDDDTYVD